MKTINVFDSQNSWELISPAKDVAMNIRRCSCEFAMDHYFGVDGFGRYAYLLRMPEQQCDESDDLPRLAGCDVAWKVFQGVFFCITLKENEDYLIFKLLCRIVIERLEAVKPTKKRTVLKELKDVFRRCGRFFKKKGSPLSVNQARGLIGEITFLLDYVVPKVGWQHALACWKGPLGAPQDFSLDSHCIEVKSTMLAESQVINISNAEQLTTKPGEGFLFVLKLAAGEKYNPSAFTLVELVGKASDGFREHSADDLLMFQALVKQIGYGEKEKEAHVPYTISDRTFYELREGFPRITVDSLPHGVTECRYSIDLNLCSDFITTPNFLVL